MTKGKFTEYRKTKDKIKEDGDGSQGGGNMVPGLQTTTSELGQDAIYKKKLDCGIFKRIDDKKKKREYEKGTILDKIDIKTEDIKEEMTSDEAKEIFRKKWEKAYGNRPEKVIGSTAKSEREKELNKKEK
jgi:hypothetical protein